MAVDLSLTDEQVRSPRVKFPGSPKEDTATVFSSIGGYTMPNKGLRATQFLAGVTLVLMMVRAWMGVDRKITDKKTSCHGHSNKQPSMRASHALEQSPPPPNVRWGSKSHAPHGKGSRNFEPPLSSLLRAPGHPTALIWSLRPAYAPGMKKEIRQLLMP